MKKEAMKALAAFGVMDRKTARQMLEMWAGYTRLTKREVREVLRNYR